VALRAVLKVEAWIVFVVDVGFLSLVNFGGRRKSKPIAEDTIAAAVPAAQFRNRRRFKPWSTCGYSNMKLLKLFSTDGRIIS
jgi:hypothetical protein